MREPLLLFWGLAFPVGLLIVLGIAGPKKPQHSLGGVKLIVAYTPIVMVFTLTILALSAARAPLPRLVTRLERDRSADGSFGGQANLTAFAILALEDN